MQITHTKEKFVKVFNINNLGLCHDFYVQDNTLLLADVFENFKKLSLEIYGVDFIHFLSTPGLAWQTALKKTKVKLHILTDIDLLFMVEEGDRGGIYHAIHQYHVIHNNTWKILIKSKNLSI